MKILGTFYGCCGGSRGDLKESTWQQAEEYAAYELLEAMEFKNILQLSKLEATFPFDFVATQIIRREPDIYQEFEGDRYLIDVTLRTRKRVKRKKLAVWRALDFKTALLILLPKEMLAVLVEIEPSDNWISLTPQRIQQLKKAFLESAKQKTLDQPTKKEEEASSQ